MASRELRLIGLGLLLPTCAGGLAVGVGGMGRRNGQPWPAVSGLLGGTWPFPGGGV